MADCFITRKGGGISKEQFVSKDATMILYNNAFRTNLVTDFLKPNNDSSAYINNETINGGYGKTFTKKSGLDQSDYDAGIFYSNNPIDFSDYTELVICTSTHASPSTITSIGYIQIGDIPIAPQADTSYDFSNWIQIGHNQTEPVQMKYTIVSVKDIQGEKYLNFGVYNGSLNNPSSGSVTGFTVYDILLF